jgi:HK97 family phage major capsid protein
LQAGVFGQAGALVQDDLALPPIEVLRNHSVCVSAGATVFSGLRGNLLIPRITSAITPTAQPETGLALDTSPGFDQPALAPKRLTVVVTISNQWLVQCAGTGEAIIRREIAAALGLELDRQALLGQGTDLEALGIANTPGIGSVVFGGPASWPTILSLESSLTGASADRGSMAMIQTSKTRTRWKQLPKITGSSNPIFIQEESQVNGSPALCTQTLSGTDQCLFGNFGDLWLLLWGSGPQYQINRYSLSNTGQTRLVCHLFFNVIVRHPQSFCLSADSAAQ